MSWSILLQQPGKTGGRIIEGKSFSSVIEAWSYYAGWLYATGEKCKIIFRSSYLQDPIELEPDMLRRNARDMLNAVYGHAR